MIIALLDVSGAGVRTNVAKRRHADFRTTEINEPMISIGPGL